MKIKFLFAIILLSLCYLCFSHPHSFVDVEAQIHVSENGIKQIKFLWIQNDPFGEDMNTSDSAQYLKWCKMWLKEHITNDNYCCNVFINNKKIKAEKFTLDKIKLVPQKNEILFYITLNISIPITNKVNVVDIVMEDEDYYVAFTWLKDKVTFSGNREFIRNLRLTNEDQNLHFLLAPTTCEINEALPEYSPRKQSGKWLPSTFLKAQFKWNRQIHKHLQSLKIKFSWGILFLLFGAASAYGIFHAAGPGHGKSLLAAYFLTGKHSLVDIPKMAFGVTMIHTGAAFLLIILFYLSLSIIPPYQRVKVQSYLSFAMAISIILLGIYLIFRTSKSKDQNKTERPKDKHLLLLAGMFPCPQSVAIMLGCMAAGVWQIGLFMVAGVALGTFAVLVTTASICFFSSNTIPEFLTNKNIKQQPLSTILKWLKCVIIIFSGCVLAILNWPA